MLFNFSAVLVVRWCLGQIVSVPDHCLFIYFRCWFIKNFTRIFKKKVLQKVSATDCPRIRENLESLFIKLPRCLSLHIGKLRTDNHRFPCEHRRWQWLDLSERKCSLCNRLEVGDEVHYLLVCSFFSAERKTVIDKFYYSNQNILKFKELMNCTDENRLKIFVCLQKHWFKLYSDTKACQFCYSDFFRRHILLSFNCQFFGILIKVFCFSTEEICKYLSL